MNAAELVMRRRVVREFIKADPVMVVLTRAQPPVETASGGRVRPKPLPLPPQEGRIVQNTRRYNNGLINSEAGSIPHTNYLLLGMHTFDAAVDDVFEWNGDHWVITGIHPTRGESMLASIDFLGQRNRET